MSTNKKGQINKVQPTKKSKFIKSEAATNIEREKKCVHKNYVNCDGLELSLWRQNKYQSTFNEHSHHYMT